MKPQGHILAIFIAFLAATSMSFGQKSISTPAGSHQQFCNVYVPNAFTPNGDNINDRFEIKNSENCQILEFNIKIFDRWGRLIYNTSSMEKDYAWDGTADGKEVMQGVYMWAVYARIRSLNASSEVEEVKQQGTVVVIR